jgi:hypothetical protein
MDLKRNRQCQCELATDEAVHVFFSIALEYWRLEVLTTMNIITVVFWKVKHTALQNMGDLL